MTSFPGTTSLIIPEPLYSPPVWPIPFLPPSTLELQYSVSPIVSPGLKGAIRLAHNSYPLPPLKTLTQIASLAYPSLPLENNTLGLTFAHSPSPLSLPHADNSDMLHTNNSCIQEGQATQTSEVCFPPYHIQFPTPSPPLVPSSTLSPPSRPCSVPTVTPLPLVPTAEEDRFDNQENHPPTASLPHILNPYTPPPCTQCYAPLLIFGARATYLSHFVSSMTAYHLCVLPARLSALPDSFWT